MPPKLSKALIDAGADIVGIVATWLIVSLSIQGVTFSALVTQKSLIGLTIALAVYVANWVKNYRKTGDYEPPIPLTAQINDIATTQEHMLTAMTSIAQTVNSMNEDVAAMKNTLPVTPPLGPLRPTSSPSIDQPVV